MNINRRTPSNMMWCGTSACYFAEPGGCTIASVSLESDFRLSATFGISDCSREGHWAVLESLQNAKLRRIPLRLHRDCILSFLARSHTSLTSISRSRASTASTSVGCFRKRMMGLPVKKSYIGLYCHHRHFPSLCDQPNFGLYSMKSACN
jgi:hypothetical protein